MARADARAMRCKRCGEWAYLTVSGLWRHVTHDPAHDVAKDVDSIIEGDAATRLVHRELDRASRSTEPSPKSAPVHWVGDRPTSLHANGPGHIRSLGHGTTRDEAEVTCKLCLTLLARESTDLS